MVTMTSMTLTEEHPHHPRKKNASPPHIGLTLRWKLSPAPGRVEFGQNGDETTLTLETQHGQIKITYPPVN